MLRVVVQLKRGKGEVWNIDIPDAESEADARALAKGMADQNGGGWKIARTLEQLPHEADAEVV